MTLTLEVSGPQGAALGAGRRMVFGSGGGTIGRNPGDATHWYQDAVVYQLNPDDPQTSVSFLKISDDLIHFLNSDMTMLIGSLIRRRHVVASPRSWGRSSEVGARRGGRPPPSEELEH